MDWTVLIDAVVVVGVVVVLPLALGRTRSWGVCGAAVVAAFAVPVGPVAAVLASVWLAVAVAVLVGEVRRVVLGHMGDPRHTSGLRNVVHLIRSADVQQLVRPIAAGFAVVAAGALVASRGGLALLGIGEPIVQLTAVHFLFAGVGALTLAGSVSPRGALQCAAVILSTVAPPLVAVGFLTHHGLPQVGGAAVMTVGVLLTAAMQLREAVRSRPIRWLLAISGSAPWIPMGLAVTWAASLYWDLPALSIPDMARTHGLMNVVFVVAGLVARRAEDGAAGDDPALRLAPRAPAAR